MENTEIRARVAEVAAPQGGWPNLSSDLLEVKFFLQQGELDEAYELLSILQQRYPGHPELADVMRAGAGRRADRDVEQLVDSVLAGSAALAGKAARRRATVWDAPTVGRREPTSVQDVVEGSPSAPIDLTSEARPVRERTTMYRTVAPSKASRSGLTIAVDALQPAAPFADPSAPDAPAEARDTTRDSVKLKARKRSLTSRKRKVGGRERGVSFGAGVLGRFGR